MSSTQYMYYLKFTSSLYNEYSVIARSQVLAQQSGKYAIAAMEKVQAGCVGALGLLIICGHANTTGLRARAGAQQPVVRGPVGSRTLLAAVHTVRAAAQAGHLCKYSAASLILCKIQPFRQAPLCEMELTAVMDGMRIMKNITASLLAVKGRKSFTSFGRG